MSIVTEYLQTLTLHEALLKTAWMSEAYMLVPVRLEKGCADLYLCAHVGIGLHVEKLPLMVSDTAE